MTTLKITREIKLNIEEKLQTVNLSIQVAPNAKSYWINAVAETGLDLCSDDYQDALYLKATQPKNTRLRAAKSIIAEMDNILNEYENAFKDIEGEIILTESTIQAKMGSGENFYGPSGHSIIHAPSIRSLQSGECVSWYYHDIFKQGTITLTVRRNDDGYLRYYANDEDLYDKGKLDSLYKSDGVKNNTFTFFFYNELKRLVGEAHGRVQNMTGLFKQGGK